LDSEGHVIAKAHDGLDALLMIIVNDYDLMITNIRMPIINGLELLKLVKKIKGDLKVIVHTACHNYEEEAKKYGVYAYFKKPIILDKLRGFINNLNSTPT
jgi:YesN/AraC family two-component response regulator